MEYYGSRKARLDIALLRVGHLKAAEPSEIAYDPAQQREERARIREHARHGLRLTPACAIAISPSNDETIDTSIYFPNTVFIRTAPEPQIPNLTRTCAPRDVVPVWLRASTYQAPANTYLRPQCIGPRINNK